MAESVDAESSCPRPWQRHLILVLAVVAIAHSVVLALWLAPASPVRDSVSASSLATYVNPYFQQTKTDLEPQFQRVDETLQVRAEVPGRKGKVKVTPWVDVTRVDDSTLRHNVSPERSRMIARRLATNLNGAMFQMNAAQQKLIADTFAVNEMGALQARLDRAGDSGAAVANYMAFDQMATQFSSLVADTRLDDEIVGIQFRSGRRTVPPYDKRGDVSVRDMPFTWFTFGWRSYFRGSLEARTSFDTYFKK